MRKAKESDLEKVVDIVTTTFEENPGVNWMFGKKSNNKKGIRRLAKYAFYKALNRDGVYISSNEKGVALCYRFDKKAFSIKETYYQLKFALLTIPLNRIRKVLKRESYRNSIRLGSGKFYYFWFLGVLPEGKGAGIELKNALFTIAKKENTPIYLETTLKRNVSIYERIGYQVYHYWKDDKKGIEFWFMKWEP